MSKNENAALTNENGTSISKHDDSRLFEDAAKLVDIDAFRRGDNMSALTVLINEIGRFDAASLELFALECVLRAYADDYRAVSLAVMADRIRLAVAVFASQLADEKKAKPKLQPGLPISPTTAAKLIVAHEHVRMVCDAEFIDDLACKGVVGYYAYSGVSEGTYVEMTVSSVKRFAEPSINSITSVKWQDEVMAQLVREVDREGYRVAEVWDKNLVWVANGIFNLETKELEPFDPELPRLVKLGTRYVDDVPDITRTLRDGTVIKHPSDLFEMYVPYDGGVNLMWQIIRVMVTNQPMRKQVTFYNANGKNGKSTMIDLIAGIVGKRATFTTSMDSLCEGNFGVSNIVGKILGIINDSEAGAYQKNVSRWKDIVSRDLIRIERKYQEPFDYRPHSNIIAAANDLPSVREKGNAYVSRNLYVPFTGQFDGAVEDVSVRNEYVVSEAFREAVLHIALVDVAPLEEYTVPKACDELMAEWREGNDPILEFLHSPTCTQFNAVFFAPVLTPAGTNGIPPTPTTNAAQMSLFKRYELWANDFRPMAKQKMPSEKAFLKQVRALCLTDDVWVYPSTVRKDGKRDPTMLRPREWLGIGSQLGHPGIVKRDLWEAYKATKQVPFPAAPQA